MDPITDTVNLFSLSNILVPVSGCYKVDL